MADIKIPEGMTEKEYYEIHASQEEFLDWYYKQELPQYEKPSVRGNHGGGRSQLHSGRDEPCGP